MTGDYYSKYNQSIRLQILRNNCQYTIEKILPKLQREFQEFCHIDQDQYLKFDLANEKLSLEEICSEAVKCYMKLDNDLFEAYIEQKIEPIIGVIEPSMYVGKFNWDQAPEPVDSEARHELFKLDGDGLNIINVCFMLQLLSQ